MNGSVPMADSQGRIEFMVPTDLKLDSSRELLTRHRESVWEIVEEELTRYPENVDLPRLVVLARAKHGGTDVRARFLPINGIGLLTPQLDFRGDIHRVVAASLLDRHTEAASRLDAEWEENPQVDLYGGVLDRGGEQAALIAARLMNRATLKTFADNRPLIRARLAAVDSFMAIAQIGTGQRSGLSPKPVAWSTTVSGKSPLFELSDGVSITVDLPEDSADEDGHRYEPLDQDQVDAQVEGIRRDVWIFPEALLADVVERIHIVDDVRDSKVDIGGYAIGGDGQTSTVVVEGAHRRRIFYHESGHAIQTRFKKEFPEEEWRRLCPVDKYFGDAVEFIALGIYASDYHPSLLEQGFITSYASANECEDFAELSEALFIGDQRLWSALPNSPLLSSKVDLVFDFLKKVHPALTKSFFLDLAFERHRLEAAWGAAR